MAIFNKLCFSEDEVCKLFGRLCAGSAKCNATDYKRACYAIRANTYGFPTIQSFDFVARYWSGAISSRYRHVKPRAE
jgi:hypothetical protein